MLVPVNSTVQTHLYSISKNSEQRLCKNLKSNWSFFVKISLSLIHLNPNIYCCVPIICCCKYFVKYLVESKVSTSCETQFVDLFFSILLHRKGHYFTNNLIDCNPQTKSFIYCVTCLHVFIHIFSGFLHKELE